MHESVELLLVPWLKARITARVGTETPDDLEQVLPFVQVQRFVGPSGVFFDHPMVELNVFAASKADADSLAREVDWLILHELPGTTYGRSTVSRTQSMSAPAWRDYLNDNLRRFQASYALTLHALSA